jgi:hypothetical protein
MRFSDIESQVEHQPGVYEIHTASGIPLKVGIARDLLARLRRHRASRQSGLRARGCELDDATDPSQVVSKASILAKHLFFDASLTRGYALRTEPGRQEFLERCCTVRVHPCRTRHEAREIERAMERGRQFRYQGRVTNR